MHVQIAPDHTGEACHKFDPADATAVAAAEARFRELTGRAGKIIREFDAKTEQVLFIPRPHGG